jgi:ubiquinone/menaquinone biosynthesis C-methylase UbiE
METTGTKAGTASQSPTELDAKRAHVHNMWGAVAQHWAEHANYTDERHAPTTRRLLMDAAPAPGERVLELACGAGGLGLAAAALVTPGGEVVLSDVIAGMVGAAKERAAELGYRNVAARVLDLEGIAEPDGRYDVVLCRDGLQFALDPGRAVREMRRVLAPGGRVAVAVWAARSRNPWLGVILAAVTAQTGRRVPPPGLPGPFAIDDPERLAGLLVDAGFTDVEVEELDLPLRAISFTDWWERTSALAGPLAALLATLPAPAMAALRDRARDLAEPYTTPDGLEFPGLALVASGRVA